MALEQFRLTFNSAMADKPIIANLTKKYNITPILQKAQLSESAGWLQIAFQGDREEIQRAVADLTTIGVLISPVHVHSLTTADVNPLP